MKSKKHGYGTLRISSTEHYAGQFYNGLKNGSGTEVFRNGDMYVGEYHNGKFHGKGKHKIIQVPTRGQTTQNMTAISSKVPDTVTVAGWPTKTILTAIDTKVTTKLTKNVVMAFTAGKMEPLMTVSS